MNFFAFLLLCITIFAVTVDVSFARRYGKRMRHRVAKFGERDPEIACRLQADEGVCYERLERWYYDMNEMICKPFEYKGCGGNYNNFYNRNACEFYCQMIKNEKVEAAAEPEPEPDACKK